MIEQQEPVGDSSAIGQTPVRPNRRVTLHRSMAESTGEVSTDAAGNLTGFAFSSYARAEVIMGSVDSITEGYAERTGITDPEQIEEVRRRLNAEAEQQEARRQAEYADQAKIFWDDLLERHPSLRTDLSDIVGALTTQKIAEFSWVNDENPETYLSDLRKAIRFSPDTRDIQVWKLPKRYVGRATRTTQNPIEEVFPSLPPGIPGDMIQ